MVKFSIELKTQLIPEWKVAFVNYWQLKKHIKNIKNLRTLSKQPHHSHLDFRFSIFDPIRIIGDKLSGLLFTNKSDIIQVKNKIAQDRLSAVRDDGVVKDDIELLQLFSEEDEVNIFFKKLDEELDKVNQFYETKEVEFLKRGDVLKKQLQILLDLKIILIDRRHKNSSKLGSSNVHITRSHSSSGRSSDLSESTDEFSDTPTSTLKTETADQVIEKNGANYNISSTPTTRSISKKNKPKTAATGTMKINIPATTPIRMIAAFTSMLWDDLVSNPKKDEDGNGDFVNRKKIQCAEKMIRGAFVELYRGLGLLKTYSSLNMVGFTKILTKFDKVADQQASANYLKLVKRSHFISSDKVIRLMDEMESIFTKQFATNDRKKAMEFLRPRQNKESHMTTFFVGLFTGSFVTLFTLYVILAHLSEMFSLSVEAGHVESVYPVFSMFALLSLHLFMYGCNLFTWKKNRINYNFIFESSPSTDLKYRDAFLICSSVMTAVVGALVLHLILLANGFSVDAIPGGLLLIFSLLLICPLNIFYRSTRYCFIRVVRNIVFSPLYRVLMVDFFMADQLTSQIPLLRHMESTACYFLARIFKTHHYDTCKTGKLYRELAYVISFLPYYCRAMQCARRWFDENDLNHLANLGKYVSAMVAAGARLTYAKQEDNLWLGVVLVTSLVATVYQLYWDFVKDWGVFTPKSRNKWLRDDLVLKNKSIYYMSIALNVVLRVAWVETVLRFRVSLFTSRLLEFLLASLEVIRRGHWNFYRLENEHLNNVGKYRAVKSVPLPFHGSDSEY